MPHFKDKKQFLNYIRCLNNIKETSKLELLFSNGQGEIATIFSVAAIIESDAKINYLSTGSSHYLYDGWKFGDKILIPRILVKSKSSYNGVFTAYQEFGRQSTIDAITKIKNYYCYYYKFIRSDILVTKIINK